MNNYIKYQTTLAKIMRNFTCKVCSVQVLIDDDSICSNEYADEYADHRHTPADQRYRATCPRCNRTYFLTCKIEDI